MASYSGGLAEQERIRRLLETRERQRLENEDRQKEIEKQAKMATQITDKFASYKDEVEEQIKESTAGLLSLEQMREKQSRIIEDRDIRATKDKAAKQEKIRQLQEKKKNAKKRKKNHLLNKLSFGDEQDEEEADDAAENIKKTKSLRNSAADSSYLPNAAVNEDEIELRKQLRQEWEQNMEMQKNMILKIPFAYWDGTSHKYSIEVKKGNTIQQFLTKVIEEVQNDCQELRGATPEHLIFVKNDLIMPHYYTFHDFEINRIKTIHGPRLTFVNEDKKINDHSQTTVMHFPHTQIEVKTNKSQLKLGRVILRTWYERNKHIYPASRWEAFNPTQHLNAEETVKPELEFAEQVNQRFLPTD